MTSIRAIRTNRYKLVTFPGTDETGELYDIQADADESVNLIGDPSFFDLTADLRARMREMARDVGEP